MPNYGVLYTNYMIVHKNERGCVPQQGKEMEEEEEENRDAHDDGNPNGSPW